MSDLSGEALVAAFEAEKVPAERPDDWETPLPKRQREEQGETYSVRVARADWGFHDDRAKHPGETMAMVEMLGKLDRAAYDHVEAEGVVLDGDHVMYCGNVRAANGYAVLHGEPTRS